MTRRHIALVALVATLLAIAAVFALDRDEAPRPLPACPPAAARFQILPVPYEATVSYGRGTVTGGAGPYRRGHRLPGGR